MSCIYFTNSGPLVRVLGLSVLLGLNGTPWASSCSASSAISHSPSSTVAGSLLKKKKNCGRLSSVILVLTSLPFNFSNSLYAIVHFSISVRYIRRPCNSHAISATSRLRHKIWTNGFLDEVDGDCLTHTQMQISCMTGKIIHPLDLVS